VIAEKARPSSPEPREAMLDSGSYWLSGSAELDEYDDTKHGTSHRESL
jgi:hypothetical protein